MKKSHIFLPGITTAGIADWERDINQIDSLKIKEIALFLTGVTKEKRKILYEKLEKTSIERVRHIHLRDDMDAEEINFVVKKFDAKILNLHSIKGKYPYNPKHVKKYAQRLFIENAFTIPDQEELESFGGLCLDIAHWESARIDGRNPEYLKKIKQTAENNVIGCCHISSISKEYPNKEDSFLRYDVHLARKKTDLDYILNYKKYLPKYLSLELNNSLEEQLEISEYLEKIIYEN